MWIEGQVKSGEIGRRIRSTEREISQLNKDLDQSFESQEETFLILEEEVWELVGLGLIQVSDIIADVHDLAHYTRLNYTAFQKILVQPPSNQANQ